MADWCAANWCFGALNEENTREVLNIEDKYPSNVMLRFFSEYDLSKEDLNYFLGEIENEWWAQDWGFKKSWQNYGMLLQLHTGGWSGNEDIINSLERNKSFWSHLCREESGGHYWFVFPSDEKKGHSDTRTELDKTKSKFQNTVNRLKLKSGLLMHKLRERKEQARVHHHIHELVIAEIGKERFAEIVDNALKISDIRSNKQNKIQAVKEMGNILKNCSKEEKEIFECLRKKPTGVSECLKSEPPLDMKYVGFEDNEKKALSNAINHRIRMIEVGKSRVALDEKIRIYDLNEEDELILLKTILLWLNANIKRGDDDGV